MHYRVMVHTGNLESAKEAKSCSQLSPRATLASCNIAGVNLHQKPFETPVKNSC